MFENAGKVTDPKRPRTLTAFPHAVTVTERRPCRFKIAMKIACFAFLFLSPLASAQAVYVVDQFMRPGFDFDTIQGAVAVAGPLDRIEIRAANYGEQVLIQSPMTLMGEPGVFVTEIMAQGVDGPLPLTLADIQTYLWASDCDGTVLIDNAALPPLQQYGFVVRRCADVRISGVSMTTASDLSIGVIVDSTVFLSDYEKRGFFGNVGNGSSGVTLTNSNVVISNSRIMGSNGLDSSSCLAPGSYYDGGPGLSVGMGSVVRLMDTTLQGGFADFFWCGLSSPGSALRVSSDSSVISTAPISSIEGDTTAVQIEPQLPSLRFEGALTVGGASTIEIKATPGATARILLGRRPQLVAALGSAIPLANSAERAASLGSIPASGGRDLPFTVPPVARGTAIHVQVFRTLAGGQSEFSNPALLIVR